MAMARAEGRASPELSRPPDGQNTQLRGHWASTAGKLNITGRYAERPSPESSPLVAVSGGRAEAKRSRPKRPALSKSAVGPARDCGPPRSGAPLEPRLTGCCAGVRSTVGVGSRARSSPLPSGPPSVRPFVRQHGPAPAKASAPSPPTSSVFPHRRTSVLGVAAPSGPLPSVAPPDGSESSCARDLTQSDPAKGL
jgi:hypothetical protein